MRPGRSSLLSAVLHVVAFQAACVCGLKLVLVQVPQYKLRGEQALLQCDFDLEDDALYSVKWYKDDEEFYRYVPRAHPPKHSYRVDGVFVDHSRSDDKNLVLVNLNLQSTGDYRCEVSAEAPSFASVQAERQMQVVALPKDGPHISGEERLYQVGDEVSLNCTSGKSHPASELTWFINDQKVPDDDPRLEELPTESDAHGLLSSSLGLRFAVTGAHFVDGSMRLRCVAEVAPVLWQADSESVVQRDTPPPNTVREALFLVRSHSARPLATAAALLASLLMSAVT